MSLAVSPCTSGWIAQRLALALAASALVGCGDNIEGVPEAVLPEAVYAARCAAPRSGIDPGTQQAYPDTGGSMLDEKLWVRSWIDDLYLWYSEVPDVDIRSYADAADYFDQLRTPAITASGKLKDRFHFMYKTSDWEALSQSGTEASYGIQWALLADHVPRSLTVAYIEPGSPASTAGITRGANIVTIDNVDFRTGDATVLNNGMYPAGVGESHAFRLIDLGATTPRTVTLTSGNVALTPVLDVRTLPPPNDRVGYFHYTDHIAPAEKELVDAISQLRTAAVTDLVLDMRYNGGGYLDLASELAYMIAGPTATQGKVFERLTFNDKHNSDPDNTPTLFATATEDFSLPGGQPLPYLGLQRVFVLTSADTCSASEAVMNGLAGAGVEVIQIGETTCGKPYGFFPEDNCGTTFFAIQFQGVNEMGFGDYSDGFAPGQHFHGCTVADDYDHLLGDPAEARLAAALTYRATGSCASTTARRSETAPATEPAVIPKPLWRQNGISRRRR
jgi:C-terminal processing protease CtpA/Prc